MRISDWSSDVCSSDLALSTAYVHDGSGPNRPQTSRVATAAASTASTNQNETLSAMRCIGARERCACATSCTICDSTVAEPTFSARMTRLPVRSEEHTSELQSLMRISYAVFCLKTKKHKPGHTASTTNYYISNRDSTS